MSATASARPIEFRNTTLGATLAVIQAAEPSTLADAMHKMLGGMPDFFNGEAVILDFGAVTQAPERIDWAGLQSLLRRYRLQPIGVIHLPEIHHESARRAGLALIDPSQLAAQPPAETPRKPAAPAPTPAPAPAPAPAAPASTAPSAAPTAAGSATPTMFVDRPLRSGQQVYAKGGDLIVLAAVNHGAEVIADGSIHVYAPLRGKAIAGAKGNTEARIFSICMEPELLSIAGTYRTTDTPLPPDVTGKPAQIRLEGDRLVFDPISL